MPVTQILSVVGKGATGGGGGGGGGGPTYTGYWTIEFWMKKGTQTDPYPRVFNVNQWPAESIGYSSESGGEYFWTGGSPTVKNMSGLDNTWNHIAICGTPGDLFIFQNGIQFPGNARVGSVADFSNPFVIGSGGGGGNKWAGKIADFHVTRQAKYTNGNFSVPTSPMTADAYTALLVSVQNNIEPYRDYSTNNWGVSGTAAFDSDTPYSGTTNGSLSFDGTQNISYVAGPVWALDVS